MWRRALLYLASLLVAAALAVVGLFAYGLYTASPLQLIIYMNPEEYYSPPLNWVARQMLFAFHPTPEEVRDLNAEAGARYAAEFPDPVEAEAMLKHFLRRGVDIDSVDLGFNSVDPDTMPGWTALHGAAIQPNLQAVRLLLAHGANPALRDRKGRTALDLARTVQNRHPDVDYSEVIALLEAAQRKASAPGSGETR